MIRIARPALLRNLQIGFGLSLFILIVTSIASWSSIRNLMDGGRLVDHTDSVINELNITLATLTDAETGQRGYLLTADTAFLRPYVGANDRALAMIDKIEAMTIDNPLQQANIRELRDVVGHRLNLLQEIITQKQNDNIFSLEDIRKGRGYMNEAREVVRRMQGEEHRLLEARLDKVRRFSIYTPVLIVIAALLSILITIYFYFRVHKDYQERSGLYSELQQKDEEISRRIDIIGALAEDISGGKYQTRVDEEQSGALGTLSVSLNKMASSLEYSFGLLSDKEWLQTGIARLNEEMVGETDMHNLVSNVISFVTEYSRSSTGAFYVQDPVTRVLTLQGRYALASGIRKEVKPGEGLVGQVAANGKATLLKDVPPGDWVLSLTSGDIRPRTIMAFPFFYERKLRGVIELGSLEYYTDRDLEFFRVIADNIGAAVHSIESRLRLQELLEETQAQSEELQSQHRELESINLELEVQSEKLQVSEEELKVQQEELMQTNQELEERSRSLEEKNQLVLMRNLDIQKKAEELALSTKYKSDFLANMSHELRTPLNSILLLSRLLVENGTQNLSGDQIEYARVIQNSGQGLLQLIDEILDLSRIESGKLPLEHAIVPVAVVLEDMRQLFGPIAKDKNLELHIVTEEGAPAQLETDKQRLEQIIKNLMANAFKFTQRGFVTLRAAPSPDQPNFIKFSVRDSGIGIPAEKHQLIFEAFQQADGSTRRKYGGTGLGLSICRELCRLLGGEISVESDPGEGAEFTVSLPLFRMEPVAGGSGDGASVPSAAFPMDAGPLFTLSDVPEEIPDDRNYLQPDDKVLLIVEDDTLFAQSLLDFTRKKGYKGIVAVSGDAGIQMARRYHPMGILLDIQLPVKNGWEVMDELKRNPQTRGIPVHIMSSYEVRNESLMKGAVDFMSKQALFGNMEEAFGKIDYWLNRNARKVLIVEDNIRHAQALAWFMSSHHLNMEIAATIQESVGLLAKESVHGVILSRAIGKEELDTLEMMRKDQSLENVPIIVFTGMNISKGEEARLRQFADSIVVKTAHSYQRVLDEVSLFLHVVSENRGKGEGNGYGRLGGLEEVLKDKIVLVADDDVRNIFSLTKALEQHKMKVLSAMDGKEALDTAEKGQPDIVLMDMMMPEMDGFEAISRMRKNPKLKHLPIIAVTAKAMIGDREKCIQAGASDYISKPVDVDQLLSLLRIWLYEK